MMNNRNKVLPLIVALMTLASCASTSIITSSIGAEDGPLGPYLETIDVRMIKYIDPTAASNLAKLTSITGETIEDNRWIRGYKDELNISIEYDLVGSGDAYLMQWAGLMATGDIPDVFPVGYADLQELGQNGFLEDLKPAFEEFASPLLREILEEAGSEVIQSVTVDGEMWGIPQVVSKYDSYNYLWIRRDWMANVGVFEAPKTIYELINLMGKFVNDDPDQDGLDDTYAFALANDLWFNLKGFFAAFGAYPSGWILDEETNKIKLGAIDEAMVEPLNVLQTMYANDWINPEFITLDYTRSKADIASGKSGIYMGAHYNAHDLMASKTFDNDADWAVFPWPGKTEAEPVLQQLPLGVNDVLAVRRGFGNPEVAVKMLNYYYEKLYGETGNYDVWGNDQVDLVWAMGPLFSYRPTINLIPYLDIQAYYAGTKGANELTGPSKNYYKNIITNERYDWIIMFGNLPENDLVSGGNTAGYFLDKIVSGIIPTEADRFYGMPTPSMGIVGSQLGTDALEFFTLAITGQRNTTSNYADFIDYWLDNGGAQMTSEINTRFGL